MSVLRNEGVEHDLSYLNRGSCTYSNADQGNILGHDDCSKLKDAGLVERIVKMVERERVWIGPVVRVSAFGREGRWFKSTKGYIPDRDKCANRLVRLRITVMLDIRKAVTP